LGILNKLCVCMRKAKNSGSVLILVLWVLFALTTLTVAIGSHVSATMSISERLWRITESRALAEAGAHQALMAAMAMSKQTNVFDGVTEDSWNRDEKFFFEREVGLGSCSVNYLTVMDSGTIVTNIGIIGEDGKININAIRNETTRKALVNLIEYVGELDEETSQKIVNSIASLIGEDEDADKDEDEGLTDDTKNDYSDQSSPMKSVAELMVVNGIDSDLYIRLLPYLTVYSYMSNGDSEPFVNFNCASKPVLFAIAMACEDGSERDVCESLANIIVDFTQSGNSFEKSDSQSPILKQLTDFADLSGEERDIFGSMLGHAIKFKSSAFRGISSGVGEDGVGTEISVEFVCDTDGKFVYWHEIQ